MINNNVVTLTVSNLRDDVSHVIFQAHSQWDQLKLSQDSKESRDHSAIGTNVAVLKLIKRNQTQEVSYLSVESKNTTEKGTHNITALVAVMVYHAGGNVQ